MPKIRIRHLVATFVVALTAPFLVGISPAHAEMTSRDCVWAPSGWDTAQVCVTVTYYQPTASQYEITKVKVEANSTGDVNRVEYGLLLWNDAQNVKWDRTGTLNSSNGWNKVFTPASLRTSAPDSTMTCWGTVYYKQSGSALFTAVANL